jgi:hypothetical protein
MDGLKLEANQGPILVEDSRICDNGTYGVRAMNSDQVKLSRNTIWGNRGGQIYVDGRRISRDFPDWETGAPNAALGQHLAIAQNKIVGTDSSQLLFMTSQAAKESSVGFFSTLSSNENTWYNPANNYVLEYDGGGPGHKAQAITLSEWRSLTGQDKNSVFSASVQSLITCTGLERLTATPR